MPKRRTITTSVLLCLALSGFIAICSREDEPRFEGKRLSYWVVLLYEHAMTPREPEFQHAEEAIRAMGTNALPYLLKWIHHEQPAWRKDLRVRLPAIIKENDTLMRGVEGQARPRAIGALQAFSILGTNAIGALPGLEALMKDPTEPQTYGRAIQALACLGRPAIPVFRTALVDPYQTNRYWIIANIRFMALGEGTNACLPLLLEALTNRDFRVRNVTTNFLAQIAPEVLTHPPQK